MTIATTEQTVSTIIYERGDMVSGPVDICVPLYRSASHFPQLLHSLSKVEVNYQLCAVVDGDDYNPHIDIEKHLPEEVPVRVIKNHTNRGFAAASNQAMKLGHAPFILWCNADIIVTPDFLEPLLCEMGRDKNVWACGGLQLEKGFIHSCGSEYDAKTKCFEHSYKGKHPDHNHPYIRNAGDRDMMTASCLLVRRQVAETLNGFDEAYRIGYWEDTDFCMRLRLAGGRIRYIPESKVIHNCNHSGAAGHKFYHHNQKLFHKRWVETGLVDAFAQHRLIRGE